MREVVTLTSTRSKQERQHGPIETNNDMRDETVRIGIHLDPLLFSLKKYIYNLLIKLKYISKS